MTNAIYYTTHTSQIGELLLVGGPKGLRYLTLMQEGEGAAALMQSLFGPASAQRLDGFFDSSIAAIDTYLSTGEALTLPYDLAGGTPLQRAVWLALTRIPYGQTISYSELAERVGFPRAVRAVASACGANPLPLVIPCHRVVAKDGTLGGFSLGGIWVKEQLLALETNTQAKRAA